MDSYSNTVTDVNGVAISGASVLVQDVNGNTATIYSDEGVTQISNPLTTDASGRFEFFAASGRYDLTIAATGYPSKTLRNIVLFDPSEAAEVGVTASGNIASTNVQDALEELDTEKVSVADLASTANGKGASLVGIEDTAGNFAATNVEAALAETLSNLASTSDHAKGDALVGVNTGDFSGTLHDYLAVTTQVVSNLTALKALTAPSTARTVYVLGRTTPGDGGGGLFRWDSSDLSTEVSADPQNGVYVTPDSDPTGASGAWVRQFTLVNVKMFGATGDGATDDTAGIQAAINAINAAGGGVLYFPEGTYLISAQGTYGPRNYGIQLKSNVVLKGAGSRFTTIKAADNSDMDIIINERLTGNSNIGLVGFKIDGNQANQVTGGFSIWLMNADHVLLDDLYSFNPSSWGYRLQELTNVFGGVLRSEHAARIGTDGFQLIDCSAVVIDKLIIDVEGGDGLMIGAENDDAHDIYIGEVVITAPVTTAADGRGILLICDEGAAASVKKIYNVTIPSAVIRNCKGNALTMTGAEFYNINIALQDYGSLRGAYLQTGSATFAGYIRNSKLVIQSWSPDENCLEMAVVNGGFYYNDIKVIGYNPGDTKVGVTVQGDYSKFDIQLDYDPLGTKVSPLMGVDVHGSYNEIHANVDGGSYCVYLRNTAHYNTIFPVRLQNGVTGDLYIHTGATGNRFVGGSVNGTISDNGTGTKFIGVDGAANYGSESVTPDANGNGTIAHGINGTPRFVQVGVRTDSVYHADVESVDGTNITVRIKDASGADVTSGTYTIDWEARL